ncbi:MAG: ABC transporter ATP-binding protein [Anaerolineae bacterium]|jgi:putative ABC transport system ATP-binding protein
MTILLESKQLNKTFVLGEENEQHVLKDVDLQIERGEFVSVMGPSGSGKSTLLYNISGMDRMTSGSVVLDGQELSNLSEEALSKVRLTEMGFIFQHIHLLGNLSIFDNIILPAYLAPNGSRTKVNRRAADLMERVGIADLADHDVTQASGGQLQRVGICRALINEPAILFGDEPTGALNSKAAAEIMNLLADINRSGTTILLVTHNPKVAARTERVLFMLDGRIVSEKRLGKYAGNGSGNRAREEDLSNWLLEMGF